VNRSETEAIAEGLRLDVDASGEVAFAPLVGAFSAMTAKRIQGGDLRLRES
jgi:hypothetical protein